MAALAQIAGRFEITAKIGEGSFGQVFLGTDAQTGGEVAIKVESRRAPHRRLPREVDAYAMLKFARRFPALHWFGVVGDCRIMVSDLLGPSLQDLFEFCNCRFSLKTVLSLADQMLECVELVHSVGLVHRDLKPDNFCIGLGLTASTVHLIDFGLAGCWLNPRTGEHITYREKKSSLTGTARFASLNAHGGVPQSRRDDLESLGYIMVYFLRGRLPWQRRKGQPTSTSLTVLAAKLAMSIEELCGQQPSEFTTYVDYCRSLGYADCPDYRYLRRLLRDLFVREGYHQDDLFDWTDVGKLAVADDKNQAITTLPVNAEKVTFEDVEL